jgi:hypothetical protein
VFIFTRGWRLILQNVAHLLIEEIIPRHSGIQILTSDNGGENYSKVMQEVCEELNHTYVKKGVGWNRRFLHGNPNLFLL